MKPRSSKCELYNTKGIAYFAAISLLSLIYITRSDFSLERQQILPHVAIQCSHHENATWDSEHKQCIFTNLCINSTHGLFGRFPISAGSMQNVDVNISADFLLIGLNSCLESQTSYPPTYLSTDVLDIENYWNPPNAVSRPVLYIWTPSCWPQKPPYHFLLHNILPLYLTMMTHDLDRFLPKREWSKGNTFRYPADMLFGRTFLLDGHVNAWTKRDQISMEFLQLGESDMYFTPFRADRSDLRDDDTQYPKLDQENVCYDKVIGGLWGPNARWRIGAIDGTIFYPEELLHHFRESTLKYYGCFPKPQSKFEKPKVLLVQRKPSTNDPHGIRVFSNIDEMDQYLSALVSERKIEYGGYSYFEERTWEDQVCKVSDVSITIAYHGNAVGLAFFMESQTVWIEFPHLNQEDSKFVSGLDLKYFDATKNTFEEMFAKAYSHWWWTHKQLNITL